MTKEEVNKLIVKLENWEKVYPEDLEKPEGQLYLEAAKGLFEVSNQADHWKGQSKYWMDNYFRLIERVVELAERVSNK